MPSIASTHNNSILTNISIQTQNTGFIADQLMPSVKVLKESDKYYKYTTRDMFQIPNTIRAPKSDYNRVDWSLTTDSYSCEEYGIEDLIDDREQKNADVPLNLAMDATEILTAQLMLAREKRVADILTDTTVITQNTTLAGGTQWNTATGVPLDVVKTARLAINIATGKMPNTMAVSQEVFEDLKTNVQLIDLYKYTNTGTLTKDIMARMFEVDNFIVAHSMYDTANLGQAASIARLWGKDALLCYIEPTPGLRRISLGYTFRTRDRSVETYREEKRKSDVIRVTEIASEKLVAAGCGYLIKNAVA